MKGEHANPNEERDLPEFDDVMNDYAKTYGGADLSGEDDGPDIKNLEGDLIESDDMDIVLNDPSMMNLI
eukprot:CAMPEP_0176363326 /NCGR_PEP_ID=MMETSP0126-20121128/19036_1 /TAXON_ID=141414 ORGANISM="Strombidinopsis acuminatum, Strain SPMC142" /NCGR_SAMPLE_ID=MMETSP0126 /ASSEMBLY_ACC=CAM_ASM_000229 /LENGTH=68 /DNA_ID=CAMNT_0017719571 /DNA_START=308 /DNA_END=514 /DNA_ORIENTATION=+